MKNRDKFLITNRLQQSLPVLTYPEAFMLVSAVEMTLDDTTFQEQYGFHGSNALRSAVRKIKNIPQQHEPPTATP